MSPRGPATGPLPTTAWRPVALACVLLAGALQALKWQGVDHAARAAFLGARAVPVIAPMPVADADLALGSIPWIGWWDRWCPAERPDLLGGAPPTNAEDRARPCFLGPIGWRIVATQGRTRLDAYGWPESGRSIVGAGFECPIERPSDPNSRGTADGSRARFEYRVSADRSIAQYRCVPFVGSRVVPEPAGMAVRVGWRFARPTERVVASPPEDAMPWRNSPASVAHLVTSLALLLAASFAAALLRSPLARELTRPWQSATRLSDDRARLADGRIVALDGAPRPGFSLLVVVDEPTGVPYRDGDLPRASAARPVSMAGLHRTLLVSERRRWVVVTLLALGSAWGACWRGL